jgi:spore coat polysaccharide biosynthesis protein SpsF
MKTVAIIQARMGSTRLPGKVLFDLAGKTVLEHVVCRCRKSNYIDDTIVATTMASRDDVIAQKTCELGATVFRGSEEDVLDRYIQAAREARADIILRIPADCPLVDHIMIDNSMKHFLSQSYDYASTRIRQTFPYGQDVEIITREALEHAWRQAQAPHQRVHVTPYIYEHPEIFRLWAIHDTDNYSHQRWTLDTHEDLAFLQTVFSTFHVDTLAWQILAEELEKHPEILALNRHVRQKPLLAL